MDRLEALIQPIKDLFAAEVADADKNPNQESFTWTFDLTTAKDRNAAFEIPFQFKSFLVVSASDSNATIYFLPNSKDQRQGVGSPWKVNGVWSSETACARGFFYWTAQSGKTITIVFFRSSRAMPGNFATSISQVYSSITTNASVTATTSAAAVFAADADAKRVVVMNQGSVSVWLGDVNVTDDTGANPGTRIDPGDAYIHDCSGVLYGVTKSSSALLSVAVYK